MTQRKAWSEQQDAVLKLLKQQRGISKWAQISRVMQEQFKISGRTGKQCRERYHNHLDRTIKRDKWQAQEEQDLIDLHNAMGNRWAEISRALTGRSENCVKNKFYSILRRGLRFINLAIKKQLKKYKELEMSVVYKLIEACEPNYLRRNLSKEMQTNLEIKKQIIYYGMKKEKQPKDDDLTPIKSLVEQIKNFAKGKLTRSESKPSLDCNPSMHFKPSTEQPSKREEQEGQSQYIFKQQPKKTSLHSMIAAQKNEFIDPFRSRSSNMSYPSLRSKNLSNISNTSRLSREREFRPHEFGHMDTIKSLQFPEFEPVASYPALQFMESYNFEPPKPLNSNSFTYLLPN